MNIKELMSSMKGSVKAKSPEILLGFGVAGMLVSVGLAVEATPKALDILEGKKVTVRQSPSKQFAYETVSATEAVKLTWKCYIPAGAAFIASTALLISGNTIHAKRSAALAAAYQLSTTAFKEFKSQTIETVGEKKVRDIKDEIAKKKVESIPVVETNVINTGYGNNLFLDTFAGRYFRSSIEHVKDSELKMNARIVNEQYISMNDFYDELRLMPNDAGDQLGFHVDFGLPFYTDKGNFHFSSQVTDTGEACTVIEFEYEPIPGYSDEAR